MRKFLSFLLTLLIIAGLGYLIWQHPEFCNKQIDKVRAVYYVYKGDREYKKLKLNKAINYYLKAVKLYPEHYGAWNNLGNIYVVYEDYFSAVDAYEQAFEHNPKMMVARMNYGVVSTERLGDFDGAVIQYDEILNTKRHLLSIPFIYSNRKSYKVNKGLAYYNKGVALKQKSIYNDFEYLERRKILLQALESYKQACKILKKDYDSRYNLALTYHLLGDYRNAGLSYCKAIKLSPMKYEAHYNLAVLLKHLRYYKESLDELEKASTLITNSTTGVSARQRYVFDVMNDVTRSLLANSSSNLVEKLTDDKYDEHSKITYVNGRIVMSDDLDKAIIKNFSVCNAKKILKEDVEELPKDEFDDVRFDVNVPGVE
mgnify:CR=1 FL=1